MLTINDVKQICGKVSLELTGTADDGAAEDVSEIVYRLDVTDCGDAVFTDRHIDIEYSYGDCYQIQEGTPLFSFIGSLCDLPMAQGEQEIMLYQAQ